MNVILKGMVSSVIIALSVVGFVDIVAENESNDVFDNGNSRPLLSSYIEEMKVSENVAIIEAKYEFNLNKCEEVIKTTLPFQEDYKGCENNIVRANTFLASL